MFTLYKYELKKILSQKYFVISIILLFLFTIAVAVTPIITGSIDSIKAKDQISGRVMNDELFNEYYDNKDYKIYDDINDFITYSLNTKEYDRPSEVEIYESRLKQIEKDYKEDYINEGEIEYWNQKESKVNKPFIYVRDDAYSEIYEVVYVVNFILIILVAIGLTGIFADEKLSGADQILYSSKFGKTKLFNAKILASLTIGIILPTIIYGGIVLINLFVYGTGGFDTAIQVHMVTAEYPMTMGESIIIMFILLLFASIVYVTSALFLSNLTQNHTTSSAIMVVIMFLSMFNIPNKYRIISQIWNDIPCGHIGSWTLLEKRLVYIFGHYFNSIEYSIVSWLLISIVLIILTKYIYKKYRVVGK